MCVYGNGTFGCDYKFSPISNRASTYSKYLAKFFNVTIYDLSDMYNAMNLEALTNNGLQSPTIHSIPSERRKRRLYSCDDIEAAVFAVQSGEVSSKLTFVEFLNTTYQAYMYTNV